MAPKKKTTLAGADGGVAGTVPMYPRVAGTHPARAARARRRRDRVLSMGKRVLLVSWEYPPVVEGGLARHVRKLAEALVRQGTSVDVLTRAIGRCAAPAGPSRKGLLAVEEVGGVRVHRVPEPGWPRDLDRFVAWVDQMNEDMLGAGSALAE